MASTLIISCSQNANKAETPIAGQTEKYVSMTCPKGDITLTLFPDSSFTVTILYWDSLTKKHTGEESIKGIWHKRDSALNLITSDDTEIDYNLTTTKMQIGSNKAQILTYAPISSDKGWFGGGYELLEQKETDKFLIQSSK